MQQQEKVVLGVSLVVTLMAGWVQVGEASAAAQESFPTCVPAASCDDAAQACANQFGGQRSDYLHFSDCLELGACPEGQQSLFCRKS